MSNKIYRPLKKDIVELFLDWDDIEPRLDQIKANNPTSSRGEKIADIETAIQDGNRGL